MVGNNGISDSMNLVELIPSLSKLSQVISISAIYKLIEHFGGSDIYTPKNPKKDSKLCHVIGIVELRKLSKAFPGVELPIPRFQRLLLKKRNQQIVLERAQGMAIKDLAKRYNLTSRHISNILREQRKV
ncbi:MAG: Mor transcription activator family protein [Pseudomonadota bacterium]